jgi:hypothetical protein
MNTKSKKLELQAMEAHIEQTVSPKLMVGFCLGFLCILFVVPLFQVLYEWHSNQKIQALDVVKHSITQPYKNAHTADSLQSILIGQLQQIKDSLLTNGSFTAQADNIHYVKEDLFRKWQHPNPHIVKDSTDAPAILRATDSSLTSLVSLLNTSTNTTTNSLLVNHIDQILSQFNSKEYKGIYPRGLLGIGKTLLSHTLFSQEYLRKYETELEDQNIVAQKTRPVMQWLQYTLFRDVGEKLVQGNSHWLFYKPGIDYLVRPYMSDPRSRVVDYNDVALTENPIAVIQEFKAQLQKNDIELLVVIVPGKASIYPEMVTSKMKAVQGKPFSHSHKAIRELRESGVQVVDLFAPFTSAKALDSAHGDSLYLKTDTHWKLRGLKEAALQVAQAVSQYSWYSDSAATKAEYITQDTTVLRQGDLTVMSQLSQHESVNNTPAFSLEPTLCQQVYAVTKDSTGAIVQKSLYRDNFRASRILILGDSFSRIYQSDAPRSAGWIAHLAKELNEPLASIVSDGGASTLVRQKLARKKNVLKNKKLVIWEFVERDFRYGAEGWKHVEL